MRKVHFVSLPNQKHVLVEQLMRIYKRYIQEIYQNRILICDCTPKTRLNKLQKQKKTLENNHKKKKVGGSKFDETKTQSLRSP